MYENIRKYCIFALSIVDGRCAKKGVSRLCDATIVTPKGFEPSS